MLFRLLLFAGIFYFGMRFFRGLFQQEPKNTDVKGKTTSRPLDLRKEDVQDANFEDIEEKK